MTAQFVELALRKQRLQIKSAVQREALAGHALALKPIFGVGDTLRSGAFWVRRHPEAIVAVGAALLVVRPRALFRWTRRGVVAWQTWQRMRAWLEARRNIQ